MPTHRQFAGRITVGLLLIVVAATVDSSGPGMTDGEHVTVPHGQGMVWSMPLGSTWEVKVDGKHVIGSGDRTDLALPSPGQRQDVMIQIRVAKDGTVMLLDTP